jgi:branched-chain amino acid transport system permease protein
VSAFIAYTIIGIVFGAGYAIAASGFVLTYTTSRIFNIAHGAEAMAGAYVYYWLCFQHGVPRGLGVLLVVGVIAPLFGIVVERLIMRGLADAPVNISVVVTIALFLLLYGIVSKAFPPDKIGPVTPLLSSVHVTIAGQLVDGNAMLIVILAAAIALAFYLFFKYTRTGVAMRGVVDNRTLLALHGGRPAVMSGLAWAIGTALAALAGILLGASNQVQIYPYITLCLLVITAYAAAVLGRLTSLPLTFLGSIILGLGYSYATGYLPTSSVYNGLKVGLPAIFLFVVLIAIPRQPLRVGQLKGIVSVPVPSALRTFVVGAVVIVLAGVIGQGLADSRALSYSRATVYAILMLSMVPLTGYLGYLNLAPLTFAGIGALVLADIHHLSGGLLRPTSPFAFLIAAAAAGVVGAVLGLLAIRLGALYLAIATLAFAELADYVLFQSNYGFSYGSQKLVERINLFGLHVRSEQAFFVFAVIVFVLLGAMVLALRRGRFGRLLIALRDSPAACGTLGLNLTLTRVLTFSLSAGMAGFAGAMYANQKLSVGATDFIFVANLPVVMLVVIGGMTSVTGAALGGVGAEVLLYGNENVKSWGFVIIAIIAFFLARQPNGLAGYLFQFGRWTRRQLGLERDPGMPASGSRAPEPELRSRGEVTVGGPV